MWACVSVCGFACVKGVFMGLLPKIRGSLNKFYAIRIGGWQREILHVTKRKTIRK